MIRVLIADIHPTFWGTQGIRSRLRFEPDFEVAGPIHLLDDDIIQSIRKANPNVLVVFIGANNAEDEELIELITRIIYELPLCSVIIAAHNDDSDVIQKYMQAGVADYLITPLEMEDLYNSIRRAYESHK